MDKPFIHLFQTPNGNYIYDINTNAILKIDDNLYKDMLVYVNTGKFNFDGSQTNEAIAFMRKQGYLSIRKWKKVAHPANDLLIYHLNSSMQTLTLQITQACNLRCKYCTYSGNFNNRFHSAKKMSLDTARKAIDFFIARSTDTEKLNFGFYGGEPLLEFEFIKKVIEYIETSCEGKEVSYNLTTNATLLNKNIIEFFEEHNVNLMVSIDGPKEIHDHNRVKIDCSSSFNDVIRNLNMVAEKFPSYVSKIRFNCVLDPSNDFGCINEFFTNYPEIKEFQGNFSEIVKEYIVNDVFDSKEEYLQSYKYEVFKLLMSKIERINKKYVSKIVESYYLNLKQSMIDNRIIINSTAETGHHGGPCIAGAQKVFVDTEGGFYPCEKVSECSEAMRIGNVNDGFDVGKIRNLINIGKLTEEECKNCWASKFCYLCALFADGIDELSKEKKLFFCNQVRTSIENQLKDYCLLTEMKFNESDETDDIPFQNITIA